MSKITNSIGYSGRVTISLTPVKGKPVNKYKNMGLQPLFDLITKFLSGDNSAKRGIPAYLDVHNGTNSLLIRPVPLVGVVWGEATGVVAENSSSISMSAVVTVSDKAEKGIVTKDVLFRLIDVDGKVLAEIQGKDLSDLYNSVVTGVDMLVEWVLTFSNSSSGS